VKHFLLVVALLSFLSPAALAEDPITVLRRAHEIGQKRGVEVVTIIGLPESHHARFYTVTNRIEINLTSFYWSDPTKYQAIYHKAKSYSTGHPDHVVLHEIAHAEHYRLIGLDKFVLLIRSAHGLDETMVAKEVGGYANANALEFVAEVQVGIEAGMKYPKIIIDRYNELRQP
jgi:hypothetical protein